MARRNRVSAPFGEFTKEVSRLERLDDENQNRLSAGTGKPGQGRVSKKQLDLLSQGIFCNL